MARVFSELADQELIALLRSGAVGVIPTDTVYGLVCRAADTQAVDRLYSLKNRQGNPGTIIAASIDDLVALGIWEENLRGAEQFWPGAVSVETPHTMTYLHQGTGRQAIRIPRDAKLQFLLTQTGPLQTTSANHPGDPTSTNTEQAQQYFGDAVDFYVNGGELGDRPPSTIIRLVAGNPEVIRAGAVKIP